MRPLGGHNNTTQQHKSPSLIVTAPSLFFWSTTDMNNDSWLESLDFLFVGDNVPVEYQLSPSAWNHTFWMKAPTVTIYPVCGLHVDLHMDGQLKWTFDNAFSSQCNQRSARRWITNDQQLSLEKLECTELDWCLSFHGFCRSSHTKMSSLEREVSRDIVKDGLLDIMYGSHEGLSHVPGWIYGLEVTHSSIWYSWMWIPFCTPPRRSLSLKMRITLFHINHVASFLSLRHFPLIIFAHTKSYLPVLYLEL